MSSFGYVVSSNTRVLLSISASLLKGQDESELPECVLGCVAQRCVTQCIVCLKTPISSRSLRLTASTARFCNVRACVDEAAMFPPAAALGESVWSSFVEEAEYSRDDTSRGGGDTSRDGGRGGGGGDDDEDDPEFDDGGEGVLSGGDGELSAAYAHDHP